MKSVGTNRAPIPAVHDERNVYADVYRLLIAGMAISTALFVAGLILALLHPGFYPLSAASLRQQSRWRALSPGLRQADAGSLMALATIVLILTPVSRVLISIWAFLVDHDYRFVVVTGVVFIIILLSVLLGRLGVQ